MMVQTGDDGAESCSQATEIVRAKEKPVQKEGGAERYLRHH